ncbi:DEAD/DEAH box helicase [Candidatus Megaera venefica]|uniref:DEAD/DEAH box helicase n=1 Tax=Candidatus Megaera venefica TaxID=2055910 RepID=A0ABU5NB44_9RICK|nr:DEAD/DEAH box helicase family protein [Candidatus Megaera venefica]MEA0970390.1 DEAD/DEAH box helicase [Candidatus Megaera venefica]
MIVLRERQTEFVQKSVKALLEHGNTLGVAPTGAGKTIMLSAVIAELEKQTPNFKACVLAHRKELTEQNMDKFTRVNGHLTTSIVNAEEKNWSGQVVFAMVQTLSNKKPLKSIPYLDLLVIDETHHVTAASYKKIIKQVQEINPTIRIFGITATPQRGDKCSLGRIFTNCGDQIFLSELIDSDHLVKPVTYVVDVAQEKLLALKKKSTGDYSESEMAEILDQAVIIDEVINHWKQKAGDRKTVIFCSTIAHAKHVAIAFMDQGIRANVVTSELTKEEREFALHQLACGEIQVLVNVAILTEGWDFPPISCVVLLRQSSYKSTMIQMIGRGLRTIDPSIYPNIVKHDCVVLDFGISSILHGCLEQDVELEKEAAKRAKKEEATKICKGCERDIPARAMKCPLCGYVHEAKIIEEIKKVDVILVDLLKSSEVQWVKPATNTFYCNGFKFWCSLSEKDGEWILAVGETNEDGADTIYQGTNFKKAFNMANSFMKRNEGLFRIKKTVEMRNEPATQKQLKYLPKHYQHVSKGEASMLLSFQFKARKELQAIGLVA